MPASTGSSRAKLAFTQSEVAQNFGLLRRTP